MCDSGPIRLFVCPVVRAMAYQTSGSCKKDIENGFGCRGRNLPHIINYISVKYDQALYAWLKDDAFIRGLFVFIVAAIMVVALQGLWRALKRCITSRTKSL